ncbi:hypothetical protein LCGC14_2391040 [marine sediment metagenome]|uniref:Uncharacterized protein n=1 Tax=marine sediment metagenome TaxID=412755 RepID=A0A0F9BYA4_9ZZZZ
MIKIEELRNKIAENLQRIEYYNYTSKNNKKIALNVLKIRNGKLEIILKKLMEAN